MRERITPHQFMMLGAAVLMGTTFFPIAQIATGVSGRDAWLAVLPAYALGVPLGLLALGMAQDYPGQNLLQISAALLGKWPAKLIGLGYLLIGTYFGALLLAQVEDTFKRSILPLTPSAVFLGGMLLMVFFLVWAGIEVFARFSEAVFPLIVLGLIANMLLVLPRFEWEEFYPLLENGIAPVFPGIVKIAPFACEYALFVAGLLAYLPQDAQERRRLRPGVWRAVLVVGILNTLLTLAEILIFGPAEAKRINYGLLALGKLVEVAKTIAGVESIFMLVWMGAMITKIAALFFIAVWGLRFVFGLAAKARWYLALAAVFFAIAWSVKGPLFLIEISFVDDYIILPFALTWFAVLGGKWYWQKRRGKVRA